MAQSVPPGRLLESAAPRPSPPARYPRQRSRKPLVVEAWLEHDGRVLRAVTRNLGVGGLFLEVEPQPSYGAKILVHLQLDPDTEELVLPAVVRWSDARGVGAQFGLLGAHATSAITAAIAQH